MFRTSLGLDARAGAREATEITFDGPAAPASGAGSASGTVPAPGAGAPSSALVAAGAGAPSGALVAAGAGAPSGALVAAGAGAPSGTVLASGGRGGPAGGLLNWSSGSERLSGFSVVYTPSEGDPAKVSLASLGTEGADGPGVFASLAPDGLEARVSGKGCLARKLRSLRESGARAREAADVAATTATELPRPGGPDSAAGWSAAARLLALPLSSESASAGGPDVSAGRPEA
jgi:hypothetical protein